MTDKAPERIFYRERLQDKNSLLVVSTECLGPDDVLYLRHDSEELVRLRRIEQAAISVRDDLILRAELSSKLVSSEPLEPIVDVSDSIWERFCDALLSAQPKGGGG